MYIKVLRHVKKFDEHTIKVNEKKKGPHIIFLEWLNESNRNIEYIPSKFFDRQLIIVNGLKRYNISIQ